MANSSRNSGPAEHRLQGRLVIVLCLFLALIQSARSQHTHYQHLGTEQGLSHNSISAMIQDRRGFLWIGTYDGLNRYDGREFLIWRHQPDDPRSLASSLVTALIEDANGDLWIGTSRGLNRLRGRDRVMDRFDLVLDPASRFPDWIASLFIAEDGTLWAGSWEGLFRFDPSSEQFEVFRHQPDQPDSLAPGGVTAIQDDGRGGIWVLTHVWPSQAATINRLVGNGRFDRFPLAGDWNQALGMHVDDRGRIWINKPGLGYFDPTRRQVVGPIVEDRTPPSNSLVQRDRSGLVWFGTEKGYLRMNLETETLVDKLDPSGGGDYLSAMTKSFVEDHQGNLWIGTRGGLFRIDRYRKPFNLRRHLPGDPASLASDRVSAVITDPAGRLWVGYYGAGLSRIDGDDAEHFRHQPDVPTSLCDDTVWHLAMDYRGHLLIGTSNGLCEYDPAADRFQSHPAQLPEVWGSDSTVTYVLEDGDRNLWLGSQMGVLKYEPTTGRTTSHRPGDDGSGPPEPGVFSLALGDDGALWVGSQSWVGVSRVDREQGRFEYFPLVLASGESLQGEGVFQLHASNGVVWLAHNDGLSRFDPSQRTFHHFSVQDGLPASIVYSMLEDDSGRLWLGTSRGLSRFEPKTVEFRNFDLADGIGNIEFNRHAVWAGADGTFHLGGMNGLTSFDPASVGDNPVPPPVVLTRIRVWTDKGMIEKDPAAVTGLRLTHRQDTVSFEFAALNFTSPEKNQYSYLLEGFDADWVAAGDHPVARYARLPPGHYRFRARGSNNDGVWNLDGLTLPLTINPPYWQTWWFRTLLGLLTVALLTLAYRLRVAHLVALERMRLRIASDLHDEVSSDLSGIALASDLLQHRTGLKGEEKVQLDTIRRTALRTVGNLRDIVWYINPDHDRGASLLERFRATGQRMLPDTDLTIEFDPELAEAAFDMGLRRNLYLIYKESLHNIQRHAGAGSVTVTARRHDGAMVLQVTDDGIGLAADHVAGVGLSSMSRRASAMGGRFEIEPLGDGGTRVQIIVPMARIRDGGGGRSGPTLNDG